MKQPQSPSPRLASLDILRGFDLFLLVGLQPVLVALGHTIDAPWLNNILYQFDHEVWNGFRFWDLVMPLFLFMTGAAMPFSFARYHNQPDKKAIYRRILRRVMLLFLLGMVVQGNLLALDPRHIYLYTNTLQAIGAGYLIASILLLHCTLRGQIIATALLLLAYWVPMTFCGDFTPQGNFAEQVDRLILGRFRDGAHLNPDGTLTFAPGYTYTWIWSTLTFGVTVMLGTFATRIILHHRHNPLKTVKILLLTALALLAAAQLWSLQMPINKRLWSASMTLLSGGYCFLLLAIFYYWIDCRRHTRGLTWLKVYGMNSITAYLLGEVINFRSIVASLSHGLEQYLGSYYAVWLTLGNFLILYLILRLMHKQQIYLKL